MRSTSTWPRSVEPTSTVAVPLGMVARVEPVPPARRRSWWSWWSARRRSSIGPASFDDELHAEDQRDDSAERRRERRRRRRRGDQRRDSVARSGRGGGGGGHRSQNLRGRRGPARPRDRVRLMARQVEPDRTANVSAMATSKADLDGGVPAVTDHGDDLDDELRAADGRVPGPSGPGHPPAPARAHRRDAADQQLPRPQGRRHRPGRRHLAGHLLPVLPRGRVGHPRAGRGDGPRGSGAHRHRPRRQLEGQGRLRHRRRRWSTGSWASGRTTAR